VLRGIRTFASNYPGKLVSETMLLDRENTDADEISGIADYLKKISPGVAYLCIPERPQAAAGVHIPEEEQLQRAEQVFGDAGLEVCKLWTL
jgi:wyosine [tRNA(Phe)-imidazoG37] synthetase (radical SAM superfamily)